MKDKTTAFARAHFTLACGALLLASSQSFAQGTFGPVTVLRTAMGTPLISSTQLIGSFSASGPAFVHFAFGFSTDEPVASGVFYDSLTLTLGEANGPLSAIYNATDRNGSLWAPSTPGTIYITPGGILRQTISFPNLSPFYTNQFSYFVTAPVPNELLGRELNFYVDLFDNQNGIGSLGWVSALTPVPEPSTWALAVIALLFFFGFQWRTK